MLAPYGDWPNAQGLQRFRKDDAVNIVNEFKSLASLPQRVLGLPWYVGHPDHDAFKADYKDKTAKGRIKKLEARDDGLWANVRWNDEGKSLIKAEAFHGHSVNWRMRQNGGAWSPFSLKSVGFTNEPQIPVPPVLVANEKVDGAEMDVVMVANGADGETARERWAAWEAGRGGDGKSGGAPKFREARKQGAGRESAAAEKASEKADKFGTPALAKDAQLAHLTARASHDRLAKSATKGSAEENEHIGMAQKHSTEAERFKKSAEGHRLSEGAFYGKPGVKEKLAATRQRNRSFWSK